MARPRGLLVATAALLILAAVSSVHDSGAATSAACPTNTPCTPIQHVVFVIKENRSFDSMFGTYPGANGATTFTNSLGQVLPLNHQPDTLAADINHSWTGYHNAYDNGKLDKFSKLSGAIQNGVDMADSQLYQSDIPNYWTYAQDFALSDNFFSEVAGPSFPNRLFTIAGYGNNVISSPGIQPPSNGWGCDSYSGATVETMDAKGNTSWVYPCFDNYTLADVLDHYQIPWKFYGSLYGQQGYIFSTFDAIKHIRFGPDWTNNVVSWQNFNADAQAGNLPPVTWLNVLPNDHPPHSICEGENATVRAIDSIMSNADQWNHTAIVVVWDDFGGFYDHVVPPKGPNPNVEFGARVPALIISPYARSGYVDHTPYTFSSVLKFIEDLWGLPSMTSLDKNSNDMFNAFDFSQQPLPPVLLQPRTCPAAIDNPNVGNGD